ncbi:MAG: hypothetical protein JO072_12560 [Parafilimonas sp.]|nr:hypothetical protein [Parafilimonas sp.]
MKKIFVLAAFVFSLAVCHAQAPHAGIYVHALYAAPLDNSSQKLYNGGAGGVAGILVGKGNTRFNGSIGYSHFFADNSNDFGDESYVPVKVGIRQYIPLTLHFLYVQGNAGIGFVNHANGDNYSPFAFDFGAGVKFTAFEAALIWDNFHEKHPSGISSWLTIQAGINLGF